MPELLPHKFQTGKVILIDKPLKWTSFDVVNKVRWLIKQEIKVKKIKVGHAGTLDPLATGLLILCTGKFTKKIETLQGQEKEYTGVITLGATTASYDLEKPVDIEYPTHHITEDLVRRIAQTFVGEQEQVAPIHSAKKIEGKRAYEYAREGEQVFIKSNRIYIKEFETSICDSLELERFEDSKINREEPYQKGVHVQFRIVCSKGTYIRSIARDLGEKLDSGGHLSALRRTKIGEYNVSDAINMTDIRSIF